MSENIDCNLSIGVTDSGRIGEDILVGVLSIDKDDELCLLVNNLLISDHIVNVCGNNNEKKTPLKEEISKQYISKLIRNQSVKIAIFRIQPLEQFKLLQEITILEGQKLHEIGRSIDSSNFQYIGKALQLRYQYPKLFVETFIKSILQYMALNWFIKENNCGHADLFKQNIKNEKKMALHIIVNGGPQFSSFQDILNENLKNFWSSIKTSESSKFYWNLMVATHGIHNACDYYPVVSTINHVAEKLNGKLDNFIYSKETFCDITADEIINQKDHVGKSLVEILHDSYLERTGSTFRPPKLWRIGDFSDLGEYELTLPYLMLQKSIKEKRITAREVDDDIDSIERFYTYNNPLDRDAFLVGKIKNKEIEKISLLKEQGIEGITIINEELVDEYRTLLNGIANFVQKDECIITNEDQKIILEKIAAFEKNDFKKIEKVKIPENIV
ncbi:MAG: hypothetical protein EAX90_10095 [Candidatus Heimdallarchaeota archaeon]|nr:hypothetical protein [Candidatus Heimdallarchaeota archaeon]